MTFENVRQRKYAPISSQEPNGYSRHGHSSYPHSSANSQNEHDDHEYSEKRDHSRDTFAPAFYDHADNGYYQKDNLGFQSKIINTGASDRKFRFTKKRLMVLLAITVITMYFRLWKLSFPQKVIFDEVHFGKHAGLYINRTYFFDVHPPLAKMMLAAAGKVSGYDGKFDFKTIGLDLVAAGVPYASMRFLPAILGVAIVPITYVTMASFGCTEEASLLGSLLVAFENSFMTISRLILLDSILLFFTAVTAMFWALFLRERNNPFGTKWWCYLILTGFNLGNALSSKWVGLFLVAAIGLWTIKELWTVAIDYRNSIKTINNHFWSYVLGLIVVPLVTYMLWFAVHYAILTKSGPGNSFMSNEFQSTLEGVSIDTTLLEVYYGSKVRISHVATNAGYLHSHSSRYPSGSKQQQVTLYGYRDDNNFWTIERSLDNQAIYENSTNKEELAHIKDGDIIRLRHFSTRKHLHSHDIRAPVTNKDYVNEVSCYGDDSFAGDSNDHWIVKIMSGDKSVKDSDKVLKSIHTKFRLVHLNQKCALFSNRVKLPKWGFEQIEAVCMKNAKYPKSIWRIVDSVNDKIDYAAAPKTHLKEPTFLEKFIESHEVMFRVNNGLVGSHPFDSRPGQWVFLNRGIGYWSEGPNRIYLLGNPILWWLSFASVIAFALVSLIILLRDKRGYTDSFGGVRNLYFNAVGFASIAWSLHYFPFYIMRRQLFLHHYLPALWFAIVALATSLDMFTRKLTSRFRHAIMLSLLFYTIRSYFTYSPLGYGTPWTRQDCEKSKWFDTWDYSCSAYPEATSFFSKKQSAKKNGQEQEKELEKEPAIVPIDNFDEEEKLNEPVPKLNEEDLKVLEKDWDKYKDEKIDAGVDGDTPVDPAKSADSNKNNFAEFDGFNDIPDDVQRIELPGFGSNSNPEQAPIQNNKQDAGKQDSPLAKKEIQKGPIVDPIPNAQPATQQNPPQAQKKDPAEEPEEIQIDIGMG